MTFPATFRTMIERGTGRLEVPFTITYPCVVHGSHKAEGWGMVDTGCPRTTIPMTMLPPCVAWDDLAAGGRFRSIFGDEEKRFWRADADVLGVRFATRINVVGASRPDVAVLGLEDFGRTFRIALDYGNPAGARFTIQPYQAASAVLVPDPRFEPVAMQHMDLMKWDDGTVYRLSQDLATFGFIKDPPPFPPPQLSVDGAPPMKGLTRV